MGHLNAIPFLGTIEIHDGPLSLLGGAIHLPVGTDITTRDVLFNGGKAGLIADAGTATLLYRVFEHTDPVRRFGCRLPRLGIFDEPDLEFRDPSRTERQSFGRLGRSADCRALSHRAPSGFLPSGFGLTAYGDVGGFGVGAHSDWQVLGTIDYTPNSWIDLHLGYRSLNFDYTASGGLDLGFNVHMKGPLLGATFKF